MGYFPCEDFVFDPKDPNFDWEKFDEDCQRGYDDYMLSVREGVANTIGLGSGPAEVATYQGVSSYTGKIVSNFLESIGIIRTYP